MSITSPKRGGIFMLIAILSGLYGCVAYSPYSKSWQGAPFSELQAKWGQPSNEEYNFDTSKRSFVYRNCQHAGTNTHYVNGYRQYSTDYYSCYYHIVVVAKATNLIEYILHRQTHNVVNP